MIGTVAAQQLTVLRRQRTAPVLVGLFAALSVMAGVLGWLSTQTISRVYRQSVVFLAESGLPAPPDPIGIKPVLALLSNMTVYVPLVGALLAIVLGHVVLADERTGGTGRLLFSRQLSRRDHLTGKAVAVAAVLGLGMAVSLVVSVVALAVTNGALPSAADALRLLLFYGLSFLYLMLFALVGMAAVLLTRRRSLALLSAMGTWLVVTFALPQFVSGLRPSTALNPIVDPASTATAFFRFTAHGRPLSLSEQYKAASGSLLRTAPQEGTAALLGHVLPLAVALALLVLVAVVAGRRHDWSRSMAGE